MTRLQRQLSHTDPLIIRGVTRIPSIFSDPIFSTATSHCPRVPDSLSGMTVTGFLGMAGDFLEEMKVAGVPRSGQDPRRDRSRHNKDWLTGRGLSIVFKD